MKKILALFMFVQTFVSAQNVDLANISTGTYLYFTAIFDKDENLYGYFSLYDMGDVNENEKSFEFYILDKNLNKVMSNRINMPNKVQYLSPFINMDNDLILSPKSTYYAFSGLKKFAMPKSLKVDLKTNEISEYITYCYEDNAFLECPENKSPAEKKKEYQENKRKKDYIDHSYVSRVKGGDFLVLTLKDYFKYIKDNEIRYYDENKNLKWNFKYNEDGSKKVKENLRMLDYDDKKIYAILTEINKGKSRRFVLIFDIKTGEILLKKEISDPGVGEGYINFFHGGSYVGANDNFVFLFDNSYKKGEVNGYSLVRIDKKTNEILDKPLLFVPNIKQKLPKVNSKGIVENGYYLKRKDVFFMNDGSVKILTEKFKPEGQYTRMKTTDMVLIATDQNFNLAQVNVLEKVKSKGEYSDYLFSQKINDNNDMVFYYKDFQKDDETKDKNWILFINTIIGGKFSQEQVKISSKQDKYFTVPYIAKEGYILLREFSEKEKHNQIRLERLNF